MRKMADWELRKTHGRAAVNADQTEFRAMCYDSANLEAGIFDDRIADALDDYDSVDPRGISSWAEEDARYEGATSDIGDEILRRERILSECYPFQKTGNKLEYIGSRTFTYEFCLAVSQTPSLCEDEFVRLPRAFERLARDVVVCFLGSRAEGRRTGWPPGQHGDRPPTFKGVVEDLHEATGEWHWNPSHGRPDAPHPRDVKDEGLDFVVWKLMPDQRDGNLFLVGQCACGDDWEGKFRDTDVTRLEDWIRPLSAVPPVRVFTTPHHIPNDTYFTEVNRQAGLTLDRARIVRLAESDEFQDYSLDKMKDPYEDLISLVMNGA